MSARAASAKSIIMIAFFFTDADEEDDADERDEHQIHAADEEGEDGAQAPADGSVDRMVIGWR